MLKNRNLKLHIYFHLESEYMSTIFQSFNPSWLESEFMFKNLFFGSDEKGDSALIVDNIILFSLFTKNIIYSCICLD